MIDSKMSGFVCTSSKGTLANGNIVKVGSYCSLVSIQDLPVQGACCVSLH